jgi:pimeloyl-ACP methyl ester carboxylesterase
MRQGHWLARNNPLRAIFLATGLLAALAGCAVTPGDQLAAPAGACKIRDGQRWPGHDNALYNNMVVADDHGRLAYDEPNFTSRIRKLLDDTAAKPDRQLLVYVHGGLNTEKSIVSDGKLQQVFDEMRHSNYEPLFLIWRTGGLETWWEQVSRVRGAHRYERMIWDTPVYIATDLAQGVVRAPVTYLKQMGRVTDYYMASPEHGWKLAGEQRSYKGGSVSVENNLIKHRHIDDEHPSLASSAGYTLTFPARMLTSPFVDSLGTTAWENMVRRARTTIHQTAEFDPACLTPGSDVLQELVDDPRGTGAFVKLFRAIEDWQKPRTKAGLPPVQITLIGHSMGTIVLGDLIRLFPDLQYRDIVYMGAATSVGEFARSVIPYMRDHKDTRFYNLMLHPQREALELTAGGAVPSGSLLEWIDEMYEPPRTMLDRTLGKWRNVRQARMIIPKDVGERIVLKVFGQGYGEPTAHGDFNDARQCFWNPGYWAVPAFSDKYPDERTKWPVFDWKAWGRAEQGPEAIDACYGRFGFDFMATRRPT